MLWTGFIISMTLFMLDKLNIVVCVRCQHFKEN